MCGFSGLPKFRLFVVPERLGPDAREVRRALEHDADRPPVRVAGDAPAVAVDRRRDAAPVLQPQHRGVRVVRAADRARLDDPVVLLEERQPRGDVGRGEQREERVARRRAGVERPRRRRVQRRGRALGREVVQRAVVDERLDRHLPDDPVAVAHDDVARLDDRADRRAVDVPLLAQREHLVHARGLDDAEHPLLRLGDHDLERLEVGLAQRDLRDVDLDADLALGRHLGGRRREAGRAEVLQRDEQPLLEQLERALEQLLLLERIADLDRRALVLVGVAELGRREHGRAADPVAAGRGAEEHEHVADAGRRASGSAATTRRGRGPSR